MVRSSKQKYIECSQCQKLIIRCQLSRHMKSVHSNIYQSRKSKADINCHICDQPISSKNIARHIKQKHENENQKFGETANISTIACLKKRRKNWLTRTKIQHKESIKIHIKNKKILKSKFNCNYSFSNYYHKDFNKVNKRLKILGLGKHDSNLIAEMMKEERNPPIIIKKHNKIDGHGCFASRNIQKDELISSYSGCVLPQQQIQRRQITPNYVMSVIQSEQVSKSWSICPYLWSSFGIFFNCGVKDCNIETLMCATGDHIFILMKARKDIQKGDELLYNYNGRLGEYDTNEFKKLDL